MDPCLSGIDLATYNERNRYSGAPKLVIELDGQLPADDHLAAAVLRFGLPFRGSVDRGDPRVRATNDVSFHGDPARAVARPADNRCGFARNRRGGAAHRPNSRASAEPGRSNPAHRAERPVL